MRHRATKIFMLVLFLSLSTGSSLYAFSVLTPGGEPRAKAHGVASDPLRGGAKQFLPPRYELACHYSPGGRARARAVAMCGLEESDWETLSDVDRKLLKEADAASREVMRHSIRSYVTKALREITEGGKSEKDEVYIIDEVRSALSPVCPD